MARQFLVQGNGGKIINIASMLSFQGGIRVPSYTASKSGVLGITRLLANEWAAQGINVNAIAPGYMATNNTQQLREDSTRNQQIVDRIPAGRWGTPDDLQGPVVFSPAGLLTISMVTRLPWTEVGWRVNRAFVTKGYNVTSSAYCIKPYTV